MSTRGAPPAKTDASDLWVRLTQIPRPTSEPLPFLARKEEVGTLVFRVLTADELSTVRSRANAATKKILDDPDAKIGNLAYEEEYEQQKAYQILALAARQPDDPQFPTFLKAEDVKLQLTDDEIAVALVAYGEFRRMSGPIISELTPEEMEAWIKLLMEGGSRHPLARLSGEALIDLTMCLVSKLATSATGTSSAGSPPAASPTPSAEGAGEPKAVTESSE